MELLGDNTRIISKDSFDREKFFNQTKQEMNNSNYNQINIREIGNHLYKQILIKYNLKTSELSQLQLDDLICKHNILYARKNLSTFIHELNEVIKKNIQKIDSIQDTKINTFIPSFNDKNINSLKSNDKNEFNIIIDSNDRNIVNFKNPSEYKINFGKTRNLLSNSNNEKIGEVSRGFSNVNCIEVINISIREEQLNKESNLYVLFQIKELGSNIDGTNSTIQNSFCSLIDYSEINNHKYYKLNIKKKFNPPIDINHLTFQFKKPNGELLELIENVISLKIYS